MAFLSPLHLLLLWGGGSRCLPSCVGKRQPQSYQAVYSVPSHWSLGFDPNLILTSDSIIGLLQSEFQIWYLLLGTLPVCSLTSLDTESAHGHMCSITAPHPHDCPVMCSRCSRKFRLHLIITMVFMCMLLCFFLRYERLLMEDRPWAF